MRRLVAPAVAAALLAASSTGAWNAHGHRTITYLALDGLPPDMPGWLREKSWADMIAEQSTTPDVWRATRVPPLAHENNPDHYLDVETLEEFGLSLRTLPAYRYEYLEAMVLARREHPEKVAPYNEAADRDRTREWPGFAPYAITEHYAKLVAGFTTLRLAEMGADGKPDHRVSLARANVVYHMGVLSHFVGDAAQPLHTTRHHHGWVGENPGGYTTDYGFHAYIDGAVVDLHDLDFESLRPLVRFDRTVHERDPWPDVIDHLERSFACVEPLYRLEKTGDLRKEAGARFISERLCDGAGTLSALYAAAWKASEPTDEQVAAYLKYNAVDPAKLPTLAPGDR